MRKAALILLIALTAAAGSARAQRLSAGINAVDGLSLATLEAEGSLSVSRYITLHLGGKVNPWTFRQGDPERQFEMRYGSLWGEVRWWPWHVYSGWWASAQGRYMIYNIGGIVSKTTEEGQAYGAGLSGGYGVMLNEHWNLDLGLGAWAGYKDYRVFRCPVCGRKLEEGGKGFILPDVRVVIQYIF